MLSTCIRSGNGSPNQGKHKNDRYPELFFQPYNPQKKDNISIGYTFPMIPINSEQFERCCNAVKHHLKKQAEFKEQVKNNTPSACEKYWKNRIITDYGPAVRKNIADVILEFHGIARNNPDDALEYIRKSEVRILFFSKSLNFMQYFSYLLLKIIRFVIN